MRRFLPDCEMDVRAGGVAGAAAGADDLPLAHRLPLGHLGAAHVAIERSDSVGVGDHDTDAVAAVPAGLDHRA